MPKGIIKQVMVSLRRPIVRKNQKTSYSLTRPIHSTVVIHPETKEIVDKDDLLKFIMRKNGIKLDTPGMEFNKIEFLPGDLGNTNYEL